MAKQGSAPQIEELERNAQPVELGTDDLGRVNRYGLDGCRDGFMNIEAQKKEVLARDAKRNQKGFYKQKSEKKDQGECTSLTIKNGQLVTMDMEKGEELLKFFTSVFNDSLASHISQVTEPLGGGWEKLSHCKQKASLRPFDETEQAQVNGV